MTLPRHVAIIMDGNGRWAERRGLPRMAGHRAGAANIQRIIEASIAIGLEVITIFAFSTENWSRPAGEVSAILEDIMVRLLQDQLALIHKNNCKLAFIGDLKRLPASLQQELTKAEHLTQNNSGLVVVVALSYGGRWDLLNGVKQILALVEQGVLTREQLNEGILQQQLTGSHWGDPDLLIRSGGEQRLSNFLLWQLAYSEIYFTEVLWPDFSREELEKAVAFYQSRTRRFGGC